MKKIMMEKIYFKTMISQQTCFTCQILPFCIKAWQVPSTSLSSLSVVDTSVFQRKPISVCFLLPVFRISPTVFEISLCPNLTSASADVLKPHNIVEPHHTKSTIGGHMPQQNFPLLLLTFFHILQVHKAPGSLLSASEDSSHSYPSGKATAPSHSPLLFCDASHCVV